MIQPLDPQSTGSSPSKAGSDDDDPVNNGPAAELAE